MILICVLTGSSFAQVSNTPSNLPGPVFSTSPLPKFLVAPVEVMNKPIREELVTDPKKKIKKKSIKIKKKKRKARPLTTRPVNQDEMNAPQVVLDDTHNFVSDSMVTLANRLDSFLGEKRADDELNRSGLRLSYAYRIQENARGRDQTEVRFNLRLPNLEAYFRKLTVDSKAKKNKDGTLKTNLEKEPWRFRADSGISVSIPLPQIFSRARIRKNWVYEKYITRFQEEIGWYSDRGWVNNTQLNFDREIQKNEQLLRFVNEADWRITQKRFITTHGPSILHNTSEDDVWSYNLRIGTGKDGSAYFMSSYGASIGYRRNLQGQWLFGEITPALDWPKSEGFRRTPSIMVKLESLFGRR